MASFFSKDFKSELTLGKITAKVLVALIVTLLAFSYEHISALILNIYKHLSQRLYDELLESVASGPIDYSFHSFFFLQLIFILFVFFTTFELKRRFSKILGEESLKLDRTKYQNPKIRVNGVKKIKLYLNIEIGLLIILSFSVIVLFALETSKADIQRSFNRKINIISPYIEAIQKDRIVSDFSMMKKEGDYKKINLTFDSLFKANNLKP